jgi:hypothetical protein
LNWHATTAAHLGGQKNGRLTRFIDGGARFDPTRVHPDDIVENTE